MHFLVYVNYFFIPDLHSFYLDLFLTYWLPRISFLTGVSQV